MRTFVLAAVLFVAACAKERVSPEEQVRVVLRDAIAAMEKGDVNAAAAMLSDDYADANKRTKPQLKTIATFWLRRGPVAVVAQEMDVKITGDAARATFAAYAVQGAAEIATPRDLLPQRARRMNLTVDLQREGEDWRVTSIAGDGGGGGDY